MDKSLGLVDKHSGVRAAIGMWALLFCAVAAAYGPALRGGLLWDDDRRLTAPALQTVDGLRRIWMEPGATQQYYPLSHTMFWIEHRLWGDAVLGYHLANLAWHATAALLAILILRRLGVAGAWLAGFLFALHPVCVEAVAWISEQETTLSAALYLASALAYLHFDATRRRSAYALAAGLFVLALAAKTVTATLPAALLVILWWKRGRLEARRDVLPLAPWLALGAAAGLFAAWMERASIGAQGPDFALRFAERCLVAARALWFYAAKLVWPMDLTFTYPRWHLGAVDVAYVVGALAVGAALVWAARRGWRGPLAAFLFFAGTLFPSLGFFNVYPFLFSFVADHLQYLASLGILAPLAAVLWRWVCRGDWRVAAVLLLLPGWMTWRQSGTYRDPETLYRATLARNPSSWMAHTNLGAILLRRGDVAHAIAEDEAALRLRPDYAEAQNNLGSALAQTPDRMPEAAAHFQAAIHSRPDFVEAHFNLANAWAHLPDHQADALAEYGAALRLRPDYAEAHFNRAAVRLRMGRLEDAIADYEAALALRPQDARGHNNLGRLLEQMPDRLADAIAEYQAAVRADSNYADAHYNLGLALAKADRTEDAIAEFRTTARLEPDSPRAHYNLGALLMRTPGHEAEALEQFDASLRLRPDSDLQRLADRLRAELRKR